MSQQDLNVAESVQSENPERMTIASNQRHVDGNLSGVYSACLRVSAKPLHLISLPTYV